MNILYRYARDAVNAYGYRVKDGKASWAQISWLKGKKMRLTDDKIKELTPIIERMGQQWLVKN